MGKFKIKFKRVLPEDTKTLLINTVTTSLLSKDLFDVFEYKAKSSPSNFDTKGLTDPLLLL